MCRMGPVKRSCSSQLSRQHSGSKQDRRRSGARIRILAGVAAVPDPWPRSGLFPHSHLPSLGGRFSGRGGFPLEIGSLRFDGRLGGRLCGLSLRRSGRRGPDCLPCLDSWPLFGREVRWGVLCRGRRLIWGNVDGGPAALLFTFSKQPFHTVLRLAHSTGRGILNLVAAIAVCLGRPGRYPGAAPSAARRRPPARAGPAPWRRLYLLLELLLYRGFFFYRFNGVSPPAKRGQGPGGPRPFYIIPPHLLRRASLIK